MCSHTYLDSLLTTEIGAQTLDGDVYLKVKVENIKYVSHLFIIISELASAYGWLPMHLSD